MPQVADPHAGAQGGGAPHGSAPPADARARPATATPTIDPKLLTSQIKRCTSLRALQQLHLQHAGTLNHIHASALLTHAAQISASSSHAPRQQGQQGGAHGAAAATREPATAPTQPLHSQEALQQWVLAVAADLGCCLGDCGSRELSISLWALAKLGVQPPSSWLERALAALQGRMHQAGVRGRVGEGRGGEVGAVWSCDVCQGGMLRGGALPAVYLYSICAAAGPAARQALTSSLAGGLFCLAQAARTWPMRSGRWLRCSSRPTSRGCSPFGSVASSY